MSQDEQTGTDLLRTRGLRVTRPRLAVLDVLGEGGHLEVDEIARRVRARIDTVSTQAVYDVLGALSRAGLARRIEPAGSPARFEARTGDNHHHIVCRSCGAVTDVECTVGTAPCLDASDTHGFEIDEAEVTFWGLCPDCRRHPVGDGPASGLRPFEDAPPGLHPVGEAGVPGPRPPGSAERGPGR